MTREECHELLTEIGGGGVHIGQESSDIRKENENFVTVAISTQYGGLLLEGDAIHQLYLDIVRDVATRITASTPQLLYLFFHWHVLSASRFAAAFDLFKRGYYFETVTLARTLWETGLTMAALKRQIATMSEVFGAGEEANKKSYREMIDQVRNVDSRIQKRLIWENAQLHQETKDAVGIFLRLANQATHKSFLGLALNINFVQENKALHMFPAFDTERAEASGNILFLATWCLMITVSYLGSLFPDVGTPLQTRYEKLLHFFDEEMKTPPNSVVRGFGELINKVFRVP